MPLLVETDAGPRVDALPVEVVERKGLGHPDSVCDAIAEAFGTALSRAYVERFGRVLHHNVDKVLLVGGESAPAFGGGRVLRPMVLHLAGRATGARGGVELPVAAIAREAAGTWLAANLGMLDVSSHVRIECLTRPTSGDLAELFAREGGHAARRANDTSIGVGYAPLSRLEQVVAAAERCLTDEAARAACPWAGADVKVMGVREGERFRLTVACAFVDAHVRDVADYCEKKRVLAERVRDCAAAIAGREVEVTVNAADAPDAGSLYLTVTGTSAEAGDDGEAGRGNRINGLITPMRPMTIESYAGKNAVTHVGKLYNIAAGLVAEDIVTMLPEVTDATVLLVSSIGEPVDRPQICSVRVASPDSTRLHPAIEAIVARRLAALSDTWRDLISGRLVLDRWPLEGKP